MKARQYIYEFDFDGEKDWVLATSKKEALEFHDYTMDCHEDRKIVRRLKKDELKNFYLLDIEYSEPDEDFQDESYNEDDYSCGYKIICSFEKVVEERSAPDFVATTAF